MLILSLNFWSRAECTCGVSRSGALTCHSTEIINLSALSTPSNIQLHVQQSKCSINFASSFSPLTLQLFCLFSFSKYSSFCCFSFLIQSALCFPGETLQISNCSRFQALSALLLFSFWNIHPSAFSFILLPHSYVDIFNFGSATAPAYLQPAKLFTFLSSFCPLNFQLLQLFHIVILLPFQLFPYIKLYDQLGKLFRYFHLFQPLTFHLFSLFSPFQALLVLSLYSFSAFCHILSSFSL